MTCCRSSKVNVGCSQHNLRTFIQRMRCTRNSRLTMPSAQGFVFEGFVCGSGREYGINPEAVQAGTNATAMSWFSDFTRAQARQVNDIVDYVYDRFILKVFSSPSVNIATDAKMVLRNAGTTSLTTSVHAVFD